MNASPDKQPSTEVRDVTASPPRGPCAVKPIPDPDGRFAGLVHGGIETINTFGGDVMLGAAVSYRTAAGEISTVREGFVFDWASIPRVFYWYVPPAGDGKNCYGIAALFHDWLYVHRKIGGRPVSRSECDGLFLEIMLYVGVTGWLARTMWAAVRAGGWVLWGRRADASAQIVPYNMDKKGEAL